MEMALEQQQLDDTCAPRFVAVNSLDLERWPGFSQAFTTTRVDVPSLSERELCQCRCLRRMLYEERL